jgi:hypothetical protein
VTCLAPAVERRRTGRLAAGLCSACPTACFVGAQGASATNSLPAVCLAVLTLLLAGRPATPWTWSLSALTFALALTAREGAVVVPALAWLVRWLPARPWEGGRRALMRASVHSAVAMLPLWLLLAVYCAARVAAISHPAAGSAYSLEFGPRLLFNAAVLAFHATGLSVRAQELIGAPLGIGYRNGAIVTSGTQPEPRACGGLHSWRRSRSTWDWVCVNFLISFWSA